IQEFRQNWILGGTRLKKGFADALQLLESSQQVKVARSVPIVRDREDTPLDQCPGSEGLRIAEVIVRRGSGNQILVPKKYLSEFLHLQSKTDPDLPPRINHVLDEFTSVAEGLIKGLRATQSLQSRSHILSRYL